MSARAREAMDASHAYRAQQSPRGRHVHARQADHDVPTTEPQIIIAEIKRLLDTTADRRAPER